MVKYTQRFVRGQLKYIARLNGKEIASISECNTFIDKWIVLKSGGIIGQEFSSLDAAKTFIENTAQMRSA